MSIRGSRGDRGACDPTPKPPTGCRIGVLSLSRSSTVPGQRSSAVIDLVNRVAEFGRAGGRSSTRHLPRFQKFPFAASVGEASGARTKRAERMARAVDRLNLTG